MVDQVLLLFQALFLLLLYVFIWRIVRTASRDLRLPQESFFLAPGQLAGVPTDLPKRQLVVETSPSAPLGSAYELGPGPVTIGRAEGNVIALPTDEYASSRHARIEELRDGLWVTDLGSRNGTFVNGEPVEGREQLRTGDLLRVGETELRVA
jgi:pSer/pThr/pTyr-binding forkhead associated (FHA) protein